MKITPNDKRSGRVAGSTHDAARGLRLKEILIETFPNLTSLTKIKKELSSGGSFWGSLSGSNIDNRTLGELIRRGADVRYILTGERQKQKEPPADLAGGRVGGINLPILRDPPKECPNQKACVSQAKLLKLLAEIAGLSAWSQEERDAFVDELLVVFEKTLQPRRSVVPESKDAASA